MAHYGRLRDYRFGEDVDDIRGASLYGLDEEKLGKIDDVIFDHASGGIQYLVVDSGGWLSSKKFLVPADRIQPDTKHDDDFYAPMTKQQVETLPRYEEDSFSHDHRENERDWSEYNERYRNSLETTGDVLHREASTHIITPEPDELPASGRPLPNEDRLQPDRIAGVFTDTSPNAQKTRLRPSGIAARAEDSAVPGQARPAEIPTGSESEEDRRATAGSSRPLGYSPTSSQYEAGARDPEQIYGSHSHSRLLAFEDHLRRNRVDVTASCRSCAVKQDKVA